LRTLSTALRAGHVEGLLSRAARTVRRDKGAFPELDLLRRGPVPKRARFVDRWFPHRQFLVRGPGRTLVLDLAPRLQITVVTICLAGFLGACCAVASAAWDHHANDLLTREVERLRGAARIEADRAVHDRDLLLRLGQELSRQSVERDQAAAAASADDQTLAEQKSDIDRLVTERDRAVDQRDKARAERDAALTANLEVLLQLDAQTQSTIAEVESIIASTGLDLTRVIKVPTKEDRNAPRGGPFIPWRAQVAVGNAAATQRAHGVASGLERLQALRDMLMHLPLASPVAQVEVSSGFGFRIDPFTGFAALHEGVDLRGVRNGLVYATAPGVVSYADWQGAYGNLVEIDHGFGLATRYAHLSRIEVKVGDRVALHQRLGEIGATGSATGVHLHYEVRVDGHARNPINFLKADRYVPEEISTASFRPVGLDRR
jgi:murein DD-endopeptidase MepM/ murein hydrolase activator NlpD